MKYIITVGLFVLLGLIFTEKASAAENVSFQVQKKTDISINIAGEEIKAGILLPNVEYFGDKKENQLLVPFSNVYESVSLDDSIITKESNDPAELSKSKEMIITKRQIVVFDDDKSQHPIGIINRNIRYAAVSSDNPNWLKIYFSGKTGYILKKFTEEDHGIPVLMYHHILKNSENVNFQNNMTVSYDSFNEQMDYLKNGGFRTIDLDVLENYLKFHQNLTGRVVVLTFDDGLLSTIHYAYPILKENHFRATDFVIGSRLYQHSLPFNSDSLQYMGFNDIRSNKDVFSYESHTFAMHLRDRDTFEPYLQYKSGEDIVEDLKKWNQFTGIHARYLAYPWGQTNKTAEKAASEAGIHMAFTTETGNVNIGDPLLLLKRQGISRYHSMAAFIEKVENE
ncbi:polysaccharide deacetylase family protein [Falsibacillus albus]|nr:polysaccharide deacetylase family protein [Falsibacillus albus]